MADTLKEKLVRGLHDAVRYFNEGDSPTDAVIKSAKDHNLNTHQAERLTETFNTARTINHFTKYADDGSEIRSASFSLADKDLVLLGLFGAKEKQAHTMYDYSYYEKPPALRQEIDIMPEKRSNELLDMSVDNQALRLQRIRTTYSDLHEEAMSKSAMAQIVVDESLSRAAGLLKRSFMEHGNDMVNRLFFTFSAPEYKPTLTKLASLFPSYLEFEPDSRARYGALLDDRDLGELKSLIKRAHTLTQESSEFIKMAQGLKGDVTYIDSQMYDIFMSEKRAEVEAEEGLSNDFFTFDNIKEADSSSMGAFDALSGTADEILDSESIFDGLVTGTPKEYKDIAKQMLNVRKGVLLEDLMINDPILSEANPRQVTGAYEALHQLAPNVAMNKEVVRAILRQAATENLAISPYDAQSLVKMEAILKSYKTQGAAMED